MNQLSLPAEWAPQSAIQLTWPHELTDWAPILDEVVPCFVAIAHEVVKREKLIIVCPNKEDVLKQLGDIDRSQIIFREMDTNDTWARDHGGITVLRDGKPIVYDFVFNGWGMKFPANFDNLITRRLASSGTFAQDVEVLNMQPFVLEGGSIESDGCGTLLTTSRCLLSYNRNECLNRQQIDVQLMKYFGANRILWLEHGFLAGDDTDSHVDTLARFCDEQTIAYVKCTDPKDEHFGELQAMEKELQAFRTADGKLYRLLPLPMADAVMWDSECINMPNNIIFEPFSSDAIHKHYERLPATYANFLILNGAVLMPFYQSEKDEQARTILQQTFPDREVIGIDCRPLIIQHGSLHCVTMQYPKGVIDG